MPKSVAVDMHALLDVVEVEREARVCPLVRVYRPGMEPLDWHLQHWQYGGAARFGADRDASLALTSSAYHRVTASRSRSPVCRTRSRFARGGSDAELPHRGVLEEWNGHFDGVIRPFRDGFVLGVDDPSLTMMLIDVAQSLRTPSAATRYSVATTFSTSVCGGISLAITGSRSCICATLFARSLGLNFVKGQLALFVSCVRDLRLLLLTSMSLVCAPLAMMSPCS